MWNLVTNWWNVYRNEWELSVTRWRYDFQADEVWREALLMHGPEATCCLGPWGTWAVFSVNATGYYGPGPLYTVTTLR